MQSKPALLGRKEIESRILMDEFAYFVVLILCIIGLTAGIEWSVLLPIALFLIMDIKLIEIKARLNELRP